MTSHGPPRDGQPAEPAGDEPLHVAVDERGVATLTLHRPHVRNAFDAGLVAALRDAAERLTPDDGVRVAVLTGEGEAFSAGADLAWMRAMREATEEENVADALALADALGTLDRAPVPVIGRVNGAAIGGGAGLVACCDVAIAAASAVFAFTEVRLGLAPAVIAPFVVARTGPAFARAAFLTGERFEASRAREVGLVHDVVADDALDAAVETAVGRCLRAGPRALAEAKRLPALVHGRAPDDVREETARLIAALRTGDEGQEGMSAFLDRRAPAWAPSSEA